MDNTLPNQQQNPTQPVEQQFPKPIKTLFIVIALILLLGVLNFFNILPLSKLFPNYLGFLPHRLYEQSLKIENGNTKQGFPTSVPNYSPNVFQYDTEKAKTTVTKYIKDNIKSEFLPENLEIKQGLSVDNRVNENLKHLFGSYLINKEETITIIFHYKEDTNTSNDFAILVQPSRIGQTALNSALANSLTTSYFVNPFRIEDCNTKGSTTYCETFKTEKDGKRGFGAIIAQDPLKPPAQLTTIVFTCLIPKESKDYEGMKSCISP